MSLYTFRDICLIRHGATAYNAEGGGIDRIRGWKNVPLSDEGRRQVQELAEKLKNSGIKFIVSSDLDRARETAEAIARRTGADLVLSQKFRPWDLGEYTGQESMAVHPVMVKAARERPHRPVPGGESFADFRGRVFSGLREFMAQKRDERMAIVTHHRDERLIHAWIALGSPANEAIDMNVMFRRGEGTAHHCHVRIDLNTLYGMVESK